MADKIIKNNAVIDNDWTIVTDPAANILTKNKIVMPMSLWNKNIPAINEHKESIGLLINHDDDLSQFQGNYADLIFIVVLFPAFSDGRGFSIGNLLRDRYGFKGELRAKGNIIRDQLYYLKRCGFDSFEFDSAVDLEAAKKSLDDFKNDYQISSNQPQPLFRRRAR